MPNFLKNLFKGRISRRKYNYLLIVYFIVALLTTVISSLVSSSSDLGVSFAKLFKSLFFVFYTPIAMKRLHDIGHSGWWLFLLIIPGAPLYLAIKSGQKVENKYGPIPK